MNDNTTVRQRRGRIGLKLAPDVLQILNEYGRDPFHLGPNPDTKPTRTEIVESAVRDWALKGFGC